MGETSRDGAVRKVLITGANGFLGQALCRFLGAAGWSVGVLVRKPQLCGLDGYTELGCFRFELPDQIDERAFYCHPDTVIHCAFETHFSRKRNFSINFLGTERLLRLSRASGCKDFFFISSLAAHPQARSEYGRCKWQLEKLVLDSGGTVIKPGTIIGEGGLFERTRELVRKNKVLPIFYENDRRIQTVWIDDLCLGIKKLAEEKFKGTFIFADYPGIRIRDYYRLLAALEDRTPKLVTVPGDMVLWLLRGLETLKIPLPLSSDNLLGLKYLHSFKPPDTGRSDFGARSFADSLAELARSEGNMGAIGRISRRALV